MKRLIIIIAALSLFPAISIGQGCMGGGSDEGVTVSGYIQPQFEMLQTEDGWDNSFTFERARFGFFGNIPYDISYYAFIETSAFKGENPYLLDAFITYTRFNPWAKISIGSFKSPFSLELNTACHKLHTIKRSRVVRELTAPDRDLGLMVSGGNDTTFLKYSFSLTNGTGLGVVDNNAFKTVTGRVVLQPWEFLHVGGSFRYGAYPSAIDTSTTEDTRLRYAAELEFKYNNFLVQAEYLMGNDDGSTTVGGGCGEEPQVVEGTFRKNGFFAQAMYMTRWGIQPIYKFERFDPNLDHGYDMVTTQTIGFNYFLNEWTRIQVNYLYTADEIEVPNDGLYIQVQVQF